MPQRLRDLERTREQERRGEHEHVDDRDQQEGEQPVTRRIRKQDQPGAGENDDPRGEHLVGAEREQPGGEHHEVEQADLPHRAHRAVEQPLADEAEQHDRERHPDQREPQRPRLSPSGPTK